MTNAYNALGKYAIMQRNLSIQLADLRQAKADEHHFWGHPSSLSLGDRVKRSIRKPTTETEKLVNLTEGSHDNLFVAKTVFPFVLFADSLKIDRQKLTIVHNSFFRTAQTTSTEVKNIINVQTEMGPLFGSMTITSKHFLNNTQTIRFLRRRDITTAQRLLQGFMIAHNAEIDTTDIEKKQLLSLLGDLGQENRW